MHAFQTYKPRPIWTREPKINKFRKWATKMTERINGKWNFQNKFISLCFIRLVYSNHIVLCFHYIAQCLFMYVHWDVSFRSRTTLRPMHVRLYGWDANVCVHSLVYLAMLHVLRMYLNTLCATYTQSVRSRTFRYQRRFSFFSFHLFLSAFLAIALSISFSSRAIYVYVLCWARCV